MRPPIAVVCASLLLFSMNASAATKKPTRPRSTTMDVVATAYCQKGRTESGTRARTGIVAADPAVLPVGSVVRIVAGAPEGIYTVMDTGSAVKGRKIDIFVASCAHAEEFGRKRVQLRVLRRGWDPKASAAEK